MPMRTRVCASAGLLLFAMAAQAFEPGHEKVCTPSADGQTFECRDSTDTSAPELRKQPAAPAPAAPVSAPSEPAPAATVSTLAAPAATSAPPPSRLPNYLLQSPGALPSSSPRASTPVEAAAPIAPVNRSDATATSSGRVDAPVASTIESAPQQVRTPVASGSEQAVSTPQPKTPQTPHTSAAAVMVETPKAEPEHAAAEHGAQPAMAAPATSPHTNLPGASEFLSLPASHYTLVLASVRNAAALDALILALANQPGRLYLLKLGMPDGAWYSLCWSDFADLDGARAARSSLPADAAITSGWPRRIGLLQKELAR